MSPVDGTLEKHRSKLGRNADDDDDDDDDEKRVTHHW